MARVITKEYLKRLKKQGFQKGHKVNLGRERADMIGNIYGIGKHPKTEFKKGQIPWNYKGSHKSTQGYIFIYMPNHPLANSKKCVKRCILIMEKYLGRFLKKEEIVHHINNIRDDDRIENFILFPNQSKHMSFHQKLKYRGK